MEDDSLDAEPFGRYELYQLELSVGLTQRVLGHAPYQGNRFVEQYLISSVSPIGYCCGSSAEGFPITIVLGARQAYLDRIDLTRPENAYVLAADWSVAHGNHELVHRFVWGTSLSSFFNEGLAMFVQAYGIARPSPGECGLTSYRYTSGLGPWIPYTPLNGYCSATRADWYVTGQCFWRRMELYNRLEAIQAFIGRLYTVVRSIDNRGSIEQLIYDDLRDLILPVVGEEYWSSISGFGMSPIMAVGTTPYVCP